MFKIFNILFLISILLSACSNQGKTSTESVIHNTEKEPISEAERRNPAPEEESVAPDNKVPKEVVEMNIQEKELMKEEKMPQKENSISKPKPTSQEVIINPTPQPKAEVITKAEPKPAVESVHSSTTKTPKVIDVVVFKKPEIEPITKTKKINEPTIVLPKSLPEKKETTIAATSKSSSNTTNVPISAPTKKIEPVIPSFNHDIWNGLLVKYVSSTGKVNYKGFKSNEAILDSYLKLLAENPIQKDWSRNKKMAYWINAYNAFTIKLILKNYPLQSIIDLDGGKTWDKKWIKLGDETYSLNNIENDILRPQFKDARIHFAVNCAAKSCPPILNKAWTASNLNLFFERQTKAFINNKQFNKITENTIEVSKIFEWYAQDFGNLIEYLNKYSSTKIDANAKISYKEYDWKLNN